MVLVTSVARNSRVTNSAMAVALFVVTVALISSLRTAWSLILSLVGITAQEIGALVVMSLCTLAVSAVTGWSFMVFTLAALLLDDKVPEIAS